MLGGVLAPLRPVTDADAIALQDLIRVCWDAYPGCVLDIDAEEPWLRAPATACANKGGWIWVLPASDTAQENPLAASVAIYPNAEDGAAELKTLYVWPSARNGGLGAALVNHAETAAIERLGASRMILWSDTRFEDAHRLYERLGYQRGGTRELHDLSNTVEYFFDRSLNGQAPHASGAGAVGDA